MHFNNSNRPSKLNIGDTVDFVFKGRVYPYVVKRDTNDGTKWLSRREGKTARNGEILTVLGFNDKPCQEAFAKSAFGGAIAAWKGSIPAAKRNQKNAMLRLVQAIFRAIDAKNAEAVALPSLNTRATALVAKLKHSINEDHDVDSLTDLLVELTSTATGTPKEHINAHLRR